MKCYISVVCVLSAFVALSLAAPAVVEDSAIATVHNQVKRQADNSELLNRVISYSNNKLQQLRRLCPQLFQVLDAVIQNVTSQVFRVVGGALLRSGGLGGGGGGGSSSGSSGGGSRVSVVLPTFPPDEDEDDDIDDDDDVDDDDEDVDVRTRINANSSTSSSLTGSASLAVTLNNPTSTENNEIDGDSLSRSSTTVSSTTVSSTSSSTTTENQATTASPTPTTSPSTLYTSPTLLDDNETVKRHIRIARSTDDQETAASGGNGPDPASDLSNVDTDDTDRNKRYLPFGGDGHAAGGSGNFLFDLIRLVAGSGATEETDEKEAGVGGVAEIDVAPKAGDGHEGIPGPITRLLVIANRGIANLIQDLILRLAQTSERIVNFKARLVTALI